MTEEQYAILVMAEELGEVAGELLTLQNQVFKAVRFGINESKDLPTTNKERIEAEWNDLLGSMLNLSKHGIELKPDLTAIQNKIIKIEKYANYSKELGEINA